MQFCAWTGLPTGYGMLTSYIPKNYDYRSSLGHSYCGTANPKAFRLRVQYGRCIYSWNWMTQYIVTTRNSVPST
ncbi:hypothetical protein BC938DRAFT_478650 [Jimgerdemannia flammicorona]|uniref:Uncharacterized protein n=1 Tax=Jimgerdemannia flammicorona TaxID=994334 RepID=A0A433P505_9FUNG|nr:hypothetical protein BC938DRAFT_478650 [Jimgerdemannia flammicorona]